MTEDRRQASCVSSRDAHVRATTPLIGAAGCLLGLGLTWVCAALIGPLRREDAAVLQWFTELERPRLDRFSTRLTALLDPLPFVAWGLALVTVALARRRARIALAIALIMPVAPLSAEALKPLLAHPHAQLGPDTHVPSASFPSGHSTAALTLALGTLLIAPARRRCPVGMLGAFFASAVGGSQTLLRRHMPSDVLGGYLVAAFWAGIAVAALRASEARRPGRT
jgi:membrane-associated phospholipid phosphatase